MRKIKEALLITAVTLASEPTWAQPPNELYSFDVISDTGTGPMCPAGCAQPVPYHLATLTVTHAAFAPDHAASLAAENFPGSTVTNNGVVSFIVSPLPWSLESWPFTPNTFGFSIDINVQIYGNDISGTIQGRGPTPGAGSMSIGSGIDEHWIGQLFQATVPIETHHVVIAVTRVPPGQASR